MIEDTKTYPEDHVNNAEDDGQFHLEGIQKNNFVGFRNLQNRSMR